MNFLILGDGPDEQAWALALADHPEHPLAVACPGLKGWPEIPAATDLDQALATAGLDAAIVGGEPDLRAEGLRRAAAVGLLIIALHPPGPNADPYYQIALSRQETGAIVVPDLPARLHPGVVAFCQSLAEPTTGVLKYERTVGPGEGDLLGEVFPGVVDLVRAVLGEIASVTALADPPGEGATSRLVVQLRAAGGLGAEVRLETGPPESARLTLTAPDGSLCLEHDPAFLGPSRLIRRSALGDESVQDLGPWDPHGAILDVLEQDRAGQDAHPDLLDATRAMELAEAVARSLHRGRTIDLHYEEISEAGNFKSLMTSTGCGLLLASLTILPLALAGPALGLPWTIYVAYIIPPLLVLFTVLQLLRIGIKPPAAGPAPESRPVSGRDPDLGART
jgi:predicted dehydrogenase